MVTIPATIRRRLDLKQAHYVQVRFLGETIELTPFTRDLQPCYPPAGPPKGGARG